MARTFSILLIALLAPAAFAQLDSDSVIVTATQTTYARPDQVVLSVTVNSNHDATIDQVVAALQGIGITAADLVSVATPQQQQWFDAAGLQWTFNLTAALAKLRSTIESLTELQKSIGTDHPGMALSFTVQGVRVSSDALSAITCSQADLISDARAKAQALADAAGLTLGPIQAVSQASSAGTAAATAIALLGNPYFGSVPSPQYCSATVKFGLLRYTIASTLCRALIHSRRSGPAESGQ